MGKSARIIGCEDFGLGARDMNRLLRKHGYLYGKPGAYGVTGKGEQFGAEQSHDNGYGGYAYRQWETITWNGDLTDALRADMAGKPDGVIGWDVPVDEDVDGDDDHDDGSSSEDVNDGLTTKEAAVVGGAILAALLVWRFGQPLWRNHVQPAAAKVRHRLATRKSAVDAAREIPERSE